MEKQPDNTMTGIQSKAADGNSGQSIHDNAAILVYSTFPTLEEAKKTGRILVERKLAACVNILPRMISIYQWEGTIEEAEEVVMIVKTIRDRSEDVLAAIGELHPYDVPAKLIIQVSGGGADFLQWINEQCG